MAALNLTTDPPDAGFPWEAVIGAMPHLLWAAVVIGLFFWIGPSSIRAAFARLSKVGVAGIELEFRDELEAAVEAHETPASDDAIERASRRLAASVGIVRGAGILWADDQPRNNRTDVRLLRSAGARVKLALSTEEALKASAHTHFDLVISDIARGDERDAGLRMAVELVKRGVTAPIIFYVGEAHKPIPNEAFGMTDRPDELLHLVLDALARRRS